MTNRGWNALVKRGSDEAMVNNSVFNPGRLAVHYNLWPKEWEGKPWQTGRLSLVGNLLLHGPSTEPNTAFFTQRGAGHLELFIADNLALDQRGRPVAALRDDSNGQATLSLLKEPDLPPGVRIRPGARIWDELPPAVGARPWDRDALDRLVLADLAARRGRIIDSETENALGYPPVQAAVRRPFDVEAWHLEDMSPKAGWPSLFASPHAPARP